MKFCCSGDQEYMTGTEATAFSVFSGMTCLGNSEKPLSTVHCKGQQRRGAITTLSPHLSPETFHTTFPRSPLVCLLRSWRTSWCERAGFAWSSTPGSKCQSAPWFSDGWCWTCSGRVEIKLINCEEKKDETDRGCSGQKNKKITITK